MAAPHLLLADSLARLEQFHRAGQHVFASDDLPSADRKRLLDAGYLTPIIRGWYQTARPSDQTGDTTSWRAHWKEFLARYAQHRFGRQWHLSPDISLLLQTAMPLATTQLQVQTGAGSNNKTELCHGWTLLDYKQPVLAPETGIIEQDGLRMLAVPYALTQVAEIFFRSQKASAEIALSLLGDSSELASALLADSKPIVAGRLVGALRAIGRATLADNLLRTLTAAGARVIESNPFATPPAVIGASIKRSPYVLRMHRMWLAARATAMAAFDEPPGAPVDATACLADIDARYVSDAYHSLSIEGYDVTPELVERVRSGQWDPDGEDRKSRGAMAAKGYSLAHDEVKASIASILQGENPGAVLRRDLPAWNLAMWRPSVQAGILLTADLAGYRSGPVYIRNALHVPPPREAVRDCMPEFFDLLEAESHPAARAVLGHFVFVFINPYIDGNGRIGRFIMNAMLASGGYPWTIIPVDQRPEYMRALDEASTNEDFAPFAKFVGELTRTQNKAIPERDTKRKLGLR